MAKQLEVTILGGGHIGGTLAKAWAAESHTVHVGVREPVDKKHADLLEAAKGKLKIGTFDEALNADSTVVVMAIPGSTMDSTIEAFKTRLDSKVVIDAANRSGGGPMNSLASFRKFTPHADVYRAFNSLGWENLANPTFKGIAADMIYCGPNGDRRAIVEQLISDTGLRPVYLGGNEQTAVVDQIATLWFALSMGRKLGRHLAFKVLTD